MPNFLQCGRTFNKTCQKGRVPTLNLACIGAKGALRKLKAGQLKLDVNGSALRGGGRRPFLSGIRPSADPKSPPLYYFEISIFCWPFFCVQFRYSQFVRGETKLADQIGAKGANLY